MEDKRKIMVDTMTILYIVGTWGTLYALIAGVLVTKFAGIVGILAATALIGWYVFSVTLFFKEAKMVKT